jgi:tetratricopeptide (TPR) repeat protein
VRALASRVKSIAERLGDDQLLVASQYYLAAAFHLSGDHRGTEQVCRKLIASLKDQQTRERSCLIVSPAVWSRAKLARVLAERGMFDEGQTHGQEAIRIAESLEHPLSILVGCLFLAYLKSVKGELSEAEQLLERAVEQCREWNFTSHTPIVMASLGHVYALSGRIQEGISCLRQALAKYEQAGIGYYHSLSMKQFGEAYLLADQIESARECANRAVMLARKRGERGFEAWSLHLSGEIASHHGRFDAASAETHYGDAMTLATELGMRPLIAHCNFGLGRLNLLTGKSKQARKHLTTAMDMYGKMSMRFWLEQGESELRRLD